MSDLTSAYERFSASLVEKLPAEGYLELPLARRTTIQHKGEPLFWLKYAGLCIAREDFKEGSIALQRVATLLDALKERYAEAPGLGPALEAFLWWRRRYSANILKRVAQGNPAVQVDLISTLQAMAEQGYSVAKRNLATSLALLLQRGAAGQTVDQPWLELLERLAGIMNATGSSADFGTQLEWATALMGAGRYSEAEQVLREFSPSPQLELRAEDEKSRQWHLLLLGWLKPYLQDPLGQAKPFTTPDPRFVLPMVVWGEKYLDSLEQFSLPSLLAPGNLPYLQGVGDTRLLIFTTDSGAQRLKQMPVFQALQQKVAVEVLTFPGELTTNPRFTYKLMSAMHLATMEIARACQAHFFFLAPDLVFADNFMQTLELRLRAGAEVIFVPGIILHLEAFLKDQAERFPLVEHALSIPPAELLAMGVRHLHPFVQRTYTYVPNARRASLAVFLWPLANGGFLVHGFHHTPFLVSAQALARFDGSMFNNLDGEWLPKIIRTQEELDRCVLLTDPLETNYFELSHTQRFGVPSDSDLGQFDMGEFDQARLCRFGALLGSVATWHFPQKICFDPSGTAPQDPAFAASTRVVEELIQGIEDVERNAAHLPIPGALP